MNFAKLCTYCTIFSCQQHHHIYTAYSSAQTVCFSSTVQRNASYDVNITQGDHDSAYPCQQHPKSSINSQHQNFRARSGVIPWRGELSQNSEHWVSESRGALVFSLHMLWVCGSVLAVCKGVFTCKATKTFEWSQCIRESTDVVHCCIAFALCLLLVGRDGTLPTK